MCCATPTAPSTCIRSGAASPSSRRASAGGPVRLPPCRCTRIAWLPPPRRTKRPAGSPPWATAAVRPGTAPAATEDRIVAWLYALPNPHPDRPIDAVELRPGAERCAVYGIATTDLTDHPLRPGTRRKVRLDLPPGASFGADRQLAGLELDLGTIISARPALDYDHAGWTDGDGATAPDVQPAVSTTRALVEYAAHPDAKLHAGGRAHPLRELETGTAAVAAAERPVKIRVVERGSSQPVAVRLHLHGAAGEYLPPKGNHRTVNGNWFEDNYGEFVNGANQYAYIPGECVADLPLGDLYVEIARGYEVQSVAHARDRRAGHRRADVRAGPGAALARARLGHRRHARALPEPADRAPGGGCRGRQRRQPAGQPVGGDVQQRQRLRRRHHAGRARLRRRRRVPGPRRHREPHAGARPHLAPGLLRADDPSAVHRRTVGVGDRRSAGGHHGGLGRPLHRSGRRGGDAAWPQPAVRARRRHRPWR